jgi:hypothetical protein
VLVSKELTVMEFWIEPVRTFHMPVSPEYRVIAPKLLFINRLEEPFSKTSGACVWRIMVELEAAPYKSLTVNVLFGIEEVKGMVTIPEVIRESITATSVNVLKRYDIYLLLYI